MINSKQDQDEDQRKLELLRQALRLGREALERGDVIIVEDADLEAFLEGLDPEPAKKVKAAAEASEPVKPFGQKP
jgi:hypothetical protein